MREKVLVERLTADPELAGDPRLLVAGVNAASVPPEFALGRSSDQVTVDERPSGVVVTVDAGQTIDVVLPVRPGGWGRAVIVQHGPHGRHVVSLVGQARSGPTGSVVLRALGQGTATVSVPPAPAAGSGPAPWRGTVVVRAPAGFECPKGASSCHRPAGPSPSGG